MLLERKWESPQVLMLGLLVLLSTFGGAILASGASALLKSQLTTHYLTLVALVASVLGFQVAGMIWVHLFLRTHGVGWAEAFGFGRRPLRALATALGALPFVLLGVLGLGLFSDWGLNQLHLWLQWAWLKPEPQLAVKLLQNQWPLHLVLVQAVVAIVVAPVAEEVLFRGILYTSLKQRGHGFLALTVPAFFFSLIHFYPVGFLSLVFLALALVVVYERTQNLLAPILLHALFNGVNFLLIVLQPKWAEDVFTP